MKNKLFDNHIKEQFGDYRPEVPSHIWQNIADKTRQRKPIGFWKTLSGAGRAIVIITFLFMLGVSAYFFQTKNTSATTPFIATNNFTQKTIPSSANNTLSISPAISGAEGEKSIPAYLTSDNNSNTSSDNFNSVRQTTSDTKRRFALSVNNAIPEADEESIILNSTEHDYFLTPFYTCFSLLNSASADMHKLKMPLLPKVATIPCPGKNKGAKKYIEIYAGPDYAFSTFSDTANSVYMLQRKASVSPVIAYSAGIRFTKVYSSGLSIRTGINYSGVNEQFRSVNGQVIQNVYITNNNGDTIGTSAVTGTQYKVSTNKYRSIDIPIAVGYELGDGRLHANVNAGVLINMHTRYTGYVADNKGNPIDISSGKSASVYSYKANAGISVTGGLSVYYQLNDKLHVLAEPYIKYGLSPVTKPDLTLTEKRHAVGFRVGLRMNL